jgi:hypothetical protein
MLTDDMDSAISRPCVNRLQAVAAHLRPASAAACRRRSGSGSAAVAARSTPCAGAAGYIASALGGAAVAWAGTNISRKLRQEQPDEPSPPAPAEPPSDDPNAVTTQLQLREILPVRGSNGQGIEDAPKVLQHLDEQMSGYIERSPFLQLGTADAAGLPYVSPKGDDAGFVMVLDPQTLIIPDRPVREEETHFLGGRTASAF